jgi:alpha-ketoglutaric semialdehyde dehydrogenase
MKPLLLLVDLQQDYLAARGLSPPAGELIDSAAWLLAGARSRGIPVAHAVTSIDPGRDERMPHWKALGRRICVQGTAGHECPFPLTPAPGEPVVRKTDFSAFSTPELDRVLASFACDTLILAGVHLHGCVRATAIDAYARRLDVWIAEDATGSDDPLHAAMTLRYLESRAVCFLPVGTILGRLSAEPDVAPGTEERLPAAVISGQSLSGRRTPVMVLVSPRQRHQRLFAVPLAGAAVAADAAAAARRAQRSWAKYPIEERAGILGRLADALERDTVTLAQRMACEVGKPVGMGEAEVLRAAELVQATAAQTEPEARRCGPGSLARRRPVGVVAAVTPWNNPISIPIGKIAPALLYGNAVVWKPAPAATRIALALLRLLQEAGVPDGVVNLVAGGRATACAVLAAPDVSAASLSGSSRTGFAAQEICSGRRIPLQAELGGNNASIVWDGTDPASTARLVAHGAFAFAGQRCTANRRAIVSRRLCDRFLDELVGALRGIRWGDPSKPETEAGPLISEEACRRVAAIVSRASAGQARVQTYDDNSVFDSLREAGTYHPPVIVVGPDSGSEIVQEETFGPVLVVQPADDFDGALELLNGVPQGLVASLLGGSALERSRFLDEAEAGIVKIDRATSDADALAPFGGWKASGVGPPEHGAADREFFTREQAVYGSV